MKIIRILIKLIRHLQLACFCINKVQTRIAKCVLLFKIFMFENKALKIIYFY